jgi:ubiquinone/menaquinone biosynthesis C-methylase UbiE
VARVTPDPLPAALPREDRVNHQDHVALLRGGVPAGGGTWADLGAGTGAFTLALAELLGPGATIYSVDLDEQSLRQQEQAVRSRFPQADVRFLAADFRGPLDLPPLDGVVMANALHFHRDRETILRAIRGWLRPGGRLLLVEYNTDRGNPWVPYPLSYRTWETLARTAGFTATQLLARVPSRFLGEIYSALSVSPASGAPRDGAEQSARP